MLPHERPSLARRGLLRGLATLPLIGGSVAMTVPAAVAATPDLDAMWHTYLTARGAENVACRLWQAAFDQLPWWVRPGPSYLRSDGSVDGAIVGFPAIQDMPPPDDPTVSRLIRPTPYLIQRDFEITRHMWSEASRITRRDAALARLSEREAAAQVERERLNVPALDQAHNQTVEATYAIEDEILALSPASAAIIAMQIMLETRHSAADDSAILSGSEMGIAALGLRGLLPMLTGEIAATARDFIADPERRFDAMRAWRGIEPAVTA